MRVRFLLDFEHALAERVGRVVVEHGHRLLPDDRPVVVLVVDEVDRAAGDFHAGIEHGLMDAIAVHARAAERRNERRVNVHDAADEVVGHRRELQEARHRHVIDARLAARAEHGIAERLIAGRAGCEILRDAARRVGMPACLGKLQSARLRRAGNDEANLDRQLILGRQFDEILQRSAAAGNEHCELSLAH